MPRTKAIKSKKIEGHQTSFVDPKKCRLSRRHRNWITRTAFRPRASPSTTPTPPKAAVAANPSRFRPVEVVDPREFPLRRDVPGKELPRLRQKPFDWQKNTKANPFLIQGCASPYPVWGLLSAHGGAGVPVAKSISLWGKCPRRIPNTRKIRGSPVINL